MKERTRTTLAALGIVAIALGLAYTSSRDDSPIVDEIPHIGAGYSYLRALDYRLNPEHPPLIKDLAAVPLLFFNLNNSAFLQPQWTDQVNGQWTFGRWLLYGSGNDPDAIKNATRLPMLLVLALGCWLIWKWTRERYSDTAAFMAVLLFAFSPTVLAHGRFVTTDMGAAVGVLAATYCFLRFLRGPCLGTFIWSALTLGLALLAKFNTALLGPYFLGIAFFFGLDGRWRDRRAWTRVLRRLGQTAAVGAAAFVFVVWPVYILNTYHYPPQRQLADTKSILTSYPNSMLKRAIVWAADKPLIRAAGHWGLGLAMVQQRSAGGNTIYWMGQVVNTGGPAYFPTVYFLKEPLAWWILFAMAITALAFHRRRHRGEAVTGSWWSRHTEEWVWMLWLAIYWVVSMRSELNIGVRHLLPVYPFTIMLVAGRLSVLADWLRTHDPARLRWLMLAIAILFGWYTFESVRVWPSYLTYFNQFAGGPSGGYRYVVDSNLDWGQDVKRLGQWVKENNVPKICVDYFGWADPAYYLQGRSVWTSVTQWKDLNDFKRNNRCGGWLAISVSFFQNANGQRTSPKQNPTNYRWLLDTPPVAVIGNSIFVWHIVK